MDCTKLPPPRCVVDWIEIAFRTARRTNLQAMRDRCGHDSMFAFNEESGARLKAKLANQGTTRFSFRVQAPRNWDAVTSVIGRVQRVVEREFGLAGPLEIIGIEVALDIKVPGADQQQLAEIVADLYASQSYAVSGNHRLYKDFRGSGKAIPTRFATLVCDLADGYQIGIGDEDADQYVHLYVKMTDNKGKDRLDPKQWRARYELRVRGVALPSRELSYWETFDFTSLSKADNEGRRLFNFRALGDDSAPMMKLFAARPAMHQQIVSRGERRKRDAEGRVTGYSVFGRDTKALPLNKRIDSALRRLNERWARKGVVLVAAVAFTEDSGDFSGLDVENPREHWEGGVKLNNYTEMHQSALDANDSQQPHHTATIVPPVEEKPQEHALADQTTREPLRPDHPQSDHTTSSVGRCDHHRMGEAEADDG